MKRSNLIIVLLFTLTAFISCTKKSEEMNYNPNVMSSKEYIRAEDALFEILNAFLKGVHDTLVQDNCFGYIDACEVCYLPEEQAMTFSYGAVNRMCTDNKFRRGSFRADFNGPVFEEGVKASILTEELFVDDSLVEVKFDLLYKGPNSSDFPEYDMNVEYCKIRLVDTIVLRRAEISSDFTLIWQEGYLTPAIHEDDTYYLTGTASGVSSDGYHFTVDVSEALENYLDCNWISSGKSRITVPSAMISTGDIDYILEDGCNNEFRFYFNDNMFFDVL